MSDDIGYPAFLEGLDETGRVVARKEIQSADDLDGSHDLTTVVEPPFIVHAVRIRGTEQTIPINLNGPLDVWARLITARMNIRAPEDNARSWGQRRNKIKQIRQRHEQGERASADADREWLLDEVDRLCEQNDARLDAAERERDEARAEVERLRAENEKLRADPLRWPQPIVVGCVCPPGANQPCGNAWCPRRSPPGIVTCGSAGR